MGYRYTEEERAVSGIWWLIFLRVLVISFLLGATAFIQSKGMEPLHPQSLSYVYAVIGITYILSLFYASLPERFKVTSYNIYLQSLFDITLITALVYVTGGFESVYSTLYPLVIIYSSLFLGMRGGLFIASISVVSYGLLLDLAYYDVIQPITGNEGQPDIKAGYALSRVLIFCVSSYLIAILTSFLSERERRSRRLLDEKESAFNQLDILYRSIIQSIATGIMTLDNEGKIKSFNRAAEKISDFTFHKVRNKPVNEIFPNFREKQKKRGKKNDDAGLIKRRFELQLISGNEHKKIIGFSTSPLIDPHGVSIGEIAIFQDLTSIKEMENQLRKDKQLAFIGEMSAALAHELRSPLSSISGSIQLLQQDLDLAGSNARLMDIILRGKDQIEYLTKNFLLLARSDPGKFKTINTQRLLDEIVDSVKYTPAWNENVQIQKNFCNQNGIYGNEAELRQALLNVINNALHAMPEGGILAIETCVIVDESKQEFLAITIKDTGCGIEAEKLEKVLEPFYTTKEKGTGLGLAIVQRIVESHKGKIRITSEQGNGTQCSLLLPANNVLETT